MSVSKLTKTLEKFISSWLNVHVHPTKRFLGCAPNSYRLWPLPAESSVERGDQCPLLQWPKRSSTEVAQPKPEENKILEKKKVYHGGEEEEEEEGWGGEGREGRMTSSNIKNSAIHFSWHMCLLACVYNVSQKWGKKFGMKNKLIVPISLLFRLPSFF